MNLNLGKFLGTLHNTVHLEKLYNIQ